MNTGKESGAIVGQIVAANRAKSYREALQLIADIASGSRTVNSLPHIEKIARGALAHDPNVLGPYRGRDDLTGVRLGDLHPPGEPVVRMTLTVPGEAEPRATWERDARGNLLPPATREPYAVDENAPRPNPIPFPRQPTSCGYCTYEESDGVLEGQCDACKAVDAALTTGNGK